MKAKVKKTGIVVTVWQYNPPLTAIPVWVARRFHNLGDGKLTAATPKGTTTLNPTDWLVYDAGLVFAFDDEGFKEDFELIQEEVK